MKWFVLNIPRWETEFFFLKSRNLIGTHLNWNQYCSSYFIIHVELLNGNFYYWTVMSLEVMIKVNCLNKNDYKWTWMSFQFKGWDRKSSKHLDCNIYIWTDITIMVLHLNNNNYKWTDIIIMVLPLNENDYKWTWMSLQFKGWDRKSSKHLDCNIYIWTDITIMVLHLKDNNYKWTDIIIMVLPLNKNDYKWTWISFQFKRWEVSWF